MDTFDEYCAKILERVDVIELIDLLGLEVTDIIDSFEEKIIEKQKQIQEYMFDEQ